MYLETLRSRIDAHAKDTTVHVTADEKSLWNSLASLFELVDIGTDENPLMAIRAKYGLFSNSFISARGSDPEAGSGGSGGGLDVQAMWYALGQPTTEKINVSHIPNLAISKITGLQAALDSKLEGITKAMVEGVLTGTITSHNHDGMYAPLSGGLIPSQYLPSYVDDVVEYASLSAFPATGEGGKIYVALDTNLTYRWGGSGYVEISPSLALGHTSGTAYPGDEGAALAERVEAMKAITDLFGIDGEGNVYVKDNKGFWSNSFISARGSDPEAGSGGGSGVDMESVWYALGQPTNEKINASHIPALQQLSGQITNAQLANSSLSVAGVSVSLGGSVSTAQIASALTAAGYKLTDTIYTLPKATVSTLGGIKAAGVRTSAITTTQGGTASGRYYGVELDANGKAFVNVPWVNTTYSLSSFGITATAAEINKLWHSGNDGSGSGLDADLLDGHHIESVRMGVSDFGAQIAAAGWYRVYTSATTNAELHSDIILHIERAYSSPQNEHYTFSISVGFNGDINITQLSGVIGGHLITKIRVVWANSQLYFIDIYTDYRNYANWYSVYGQGYGTFSAFTAGATIPSGYSSYEFTTVEGCKSSGGFTGALSGNASSATKLATARTLWGRSFDGTNNVSGDMTGVGTINGALYLSTFGSSSDNSDTAQFLTTGHRVEFGGPGYAHKGYYFRPEYGSAGETRASVYIQNASASDSPVFTTTHAFEANGNAFHRGSLGLGVSSPTFKLHVVGTGYFSGLLTASGGLTTPQYVQVGSGRLKWDAANNALYVEKSDGTACGLYSKGYMSARGSDPGAGSGGDSGVDIESVWYALAQEVQGVLPEAVREVGNGEDRHLALNYQMLHAYEVSALQTHEERLTKLENEIKRIQHGS